MSGHREMSLDTISRMVEEITPAATIRETELAESGHLSVYHLVIETPTGTHKRVLKASPDGEPHGIATEARILSIVDRHTSIPVPRVIGAVDTHEYLPAPFFLMERVAGAHLPKRAIGDLSEPVLKRLSQETGRYLAELHALDGPVEYGQVVSTPSPSLTGEQPSPDLGQLTITDLQGGSSSGQQAWTTVLRTWAEDTLERHASTRFGDMTEAIRPMLRTQLDDLDGPFPPVLGRIDHGLHNLLLESETGTITGMIDWAFTLSVPAAYDLVCVESNLSLDPWAVHPETPVRREFVRTNLLEGYTAVGQSAVIDRFHQHHSAYHLLALLRAMNHLDTVPEFVMPDASEKQVEASARRYRSLVRTLL